MEINHYHLESVDSTNNWARSHVQDFNKRGLTFVTADFQTAGRGQFNRSWISPPKENLLATYCVWLGQFDFNLPQVMALAVSEMLKERGFDIKIKWPNDLMIKGKKIGGILSESIEEESGRWIILGVGLNVNMKEDNLKLIDRPATSLFEEAERTYDPEELGRILAAWFEKSVDAYHGFAPFFQRFQAKLLHVPGDPMQVGEIKGHFKALNPDGSMTLILEDGSEKIIISGQITLL